MSIKQIPNIVTFLNLLCGVAAIICAFEGKYHISAALILIGSCFDYIDGKIAGKLDAVTQFGKELDSLADLVSFGVAPAMLAYAVILDDLGLKGAVLVLIYVMCGAFRLARFNVEIRTAHFTGLPIPIAGAIIAAAILLSNPLPVWIYPVFLAIFSVLMASRIKFLRN
jgi:CDP-diacylglycerol--serine O-phosphatidyltransferase